MRDLYLFPPVQTAAGHKPEDRVKDTGKAVQVPTPVQSWATIMAKTATALQVQRQPTQHYVFVFNHKGILHFDIFSSFVICTLPKI